MVIFIKTHASTRRILVITKTSFGFSVRFDPRHPAHWIIFSTSNSVLELSTTYLKTSKSVHKFWTDAESFKSSFKSSYSTLWTTAVELRGTSSLWIDSLIFLSSVFELYAFINAHSRCGSCDSNAMFLLGNLSIKSSCLDDISTSFVEGKVSWKAFLLIQFINTPYWSMIWIHMQDWPYYTSL